MLDREITQFGLDPAYTCSNLLAPSAWGRVQ
jgi:hypothetical protein